MLWSLLYLPCLSNLGATLTQRSASIRYAVLSQRIADLYVAGTIDGVERAHMMGALRMHGVEFGRVCDRLGGTLKAIDDNLNVIRCRGSKHDFDQILPYTGKKLANGYIEYFETCERCTTLRRTYRAPNHYKNRQGGYRYYRGFNYDFGGKASDFCSAEYKSTVFIRHLITVMEKLEGSGATISVDTEPEANRRHLASVS